MFDRWLFVIVLTIADTFSSRASSQVATDCPLELDARPGQNHL